MTSSNNGLIKLSQEDVNNLADREEAFAKRIFGDLKSHLWDHLQESHFFSYFPDSWCRPYNFRMAFSSAYMIRDYIKGKHLCHIGSAFGDLELIFSKYAQKITMVESDGSRHRTVKENLEQGRYFCELDLVDGDIFEMDIDADVYFFWMNHEMNSRLIDHLINNSKLVDDKKERIIIYPPYELTYDQKELPVNGSSEYYLAPFDENLDFFYYIDKFHCANPAEIEIAQERLDKLSKEATDEKPHGPVHSISCHPDPDLAAHLFMSHLQCDMRGYIPLKIIKF